MNEAKYRLITTKHLRQNTRPEDPLQPAFIKFVKGDILVPTDAELKFLRRIFDGPLPGEVQETIPGQSSKVVAEAPHDQTLQEKADFVLQSPIANLRDVLRSADPAFLDVLEITENQKPSPRKVLLDMIRRRKSVAA